MDLWIIHTTGSSSSTSIEVTLSAKLPSLIKTKNRSWTCLFPSFGSIKDTSVTPAWRLKDTFHLGIGQSSVQPWNRAWRIKFLPFCNAWLKYMNPPPKKCMTHAYPRMEMLSPLPHPLFSEEPLETGAPFFWKLPEHNPPDHGKRGRDRREYRRKRLFLFR